MPGVLTSHQVSEFKQNIPSKYYNKKTKNGPHLKNRGPDIAKKKKIEFLEPDREFWQKFDPGIFFGMTPEKQAWVETKKMHLPLAFWVFPKESKNK